MRGAVRDAAHDVANHAARDVVRVVAHDALYNTSCPLFVPVSFVNLSCPNQYAVWLRKKVAVLATEVYFAHYFCAHKLLGGSFALHSCIFASWT